jgi:hypothetical protein
MEDFYRDFYYQSLPVVPANGDERNETLAKRLANLLDVALTNRRKVF